MSFVISSNCLFQSSQSIKVLSNAMFQDVLAVDQLEGGESSSVILTIETIKARHSCIKQGLYHLLRVLSP